MTKQEMIDKIYEVIGYNEHIYDISNINDKVIIVMIGDVLDWCFENGIEVCGGNYDEGTTIIGLWRKTREPIESQEEKCIKYIYDLITG